MLPDKNIENELNTLAPILSKGRNQPVYAVPDGYFASFPDKMLGIVLGSAKSLETATDTTMATAVEETALLSPLLAGLSKKMPFSVPEGYFDQIEPESILVNGSKVMPYAVPSGYFENFADNLMEKIQGTRVANPASGGKVIRFGKTWIKYAAAAVISGLIVMAGWNYMKPATETPSTSQQLATQLQKEMQAISDEAMLEFTYPANTLNYGTAALQLDDLSGSEVHDLLGDVSDDALQQYLVEFNGKTATSTN